MTFDLLSLTLTLSYGNINSAEVNIRAKFHENRSKWHRSLTAVTMNMVGLFDAERFQYTSANPTSPSDTYFVVGYNYWDKKIKPKCNDILCKIVNCSVFIEK